MNRLSLLQELLSNISERGLALLGPASETALDVDELLEQCDALLSSRGEASGVAYASRILSGFVALNREQRLSFYRALANRYQPEPDEIRKAADAYLALQNPGNLQRLLEAVEPPRQELFRRLNLAPGGTAALVRMRVSRVTQKSPPMVVEFSPPSTFIGGWAEIRRRHFEAGESISAPGCWISDRKTVRRCIQTEVWQPYQLQAKSDTLLAPHEAWLRERAPKVHYSARILFTDPGTVYRTPSTKLLLPQAPVAIRHSVYCPRNEPALAERPDLLRESLFIGIGLDVDAVRRQG